MRSTDRDRGGRERRRDSDDDHDPKDRRRSEREKNGDFPWDSPSTSSRNKPSLYVDTSRPKSSREESSRGKETSSRSGAGLRTYTGRSVGYMKESKRNQEDMYDGNKELLADRCATGIDANFARVLGGSAIAEAKGALKLQSHVHSAGNIFFGLEWHEASCRFSNNRGERMREFTQRLLLLEYRHAVPQLPVEGIVGYG
ncbi:hypothetical protein BC830DRAFT_1218478 [Chytriomyces sp. MP71]|nr:hypothetical protein BC830DRAFT_1218478 [Chytriomyces sp. MP71]